METTHSQVTTEFIYSLLLRLIQHLSHIQHTNIFFSFYDTEIAKLWDADSKSPSMILFQDGLAVTRLYETSFYLDVVAKMGKYCRPEGEEHKELK